VSELTSRPRVATIGAGKAVSDRIARVPRKRQGELGDNLTLGPPQSGKIVTRVGHCYSLGKSILTEKQ
jgi:hypothetical protein